jgi:hypothetical protein
MAKLINKLIICVLFGISLSTLVSAEDLLFEDEVLFEESIQEVLHLQTQSLRPKLKC